jgi:small subunit ribosomal protein S17
MSEQKTKGRLLKGIVFSAKADKTVVVRVVRRVKHALYGKIVSRFTKVHAHDAQNSCREGDEVVIQESKPISKMKHWVLVERLERKGL